MKTYECKSCVNQATPLCEICRTVTAPDGKVYHRPTYYIAGSEIARADTKGEYLASVILSYIERRAPIPLAAVMNYNHIYEVN